MPCRSFGGMGKMTTLQNSYCVPKTKEDWALLGRGESHNFAIKGDRAFYAYDIDEGDNPYRIAMILLKDIGNHDWLTNEIPVQHFLDLLHDRITGWRLEEVGFKPWPTPNKPAMMRWENDAQYTVEVIGGGVYVNNASYNITTFTELLTLIKFLTPPPKK